MRSLLPLIILASCASTGQSISVLRDTDERNTARVEGTYELTDAPGWKGYAFAEAFSTHGEAWGGHSETDLRDWLSEIHLRTPVLDPECPVGAIVEGQAGGIVKSVSQAGVYLPLSSYAILAAFFAQTVGDGSELSLKGAYPFCDHWLLWGFADAGYPEGLYEGPVVMVASARVGYEVWRGVRVFAELDHNEYREDEDALALGLAAGW